MSELPEAGLVVIELARIALMFFSFTLLPLLVLFVIRPMFGVVSFSLQALVNRFFR